MVWLHLAVLGWLALCAWFDWKKRETPNWLTVPAIILALSARLLGLGSGDWLVSAGIIILAFVGWYSRMMGGADLKATIAMAIADPRLAVWAWAGAILWYLIIRLITWGQQGPYRLPGMVGYAAGVGLLLMYQLNMYAS